MDHEDSFYAVKNPGDSSLSNVGSTMGGMVGSDDEDSFVVLETATSLNDNSSPSSLNEEILPPLRTNKVHEMQSLIKMKLSQINSEPVPELPAAVDAIDAVASSVAKITISPDSSYEEIQKQVEELIKENETLKNTITQNNMSMKTQYGRFVGYKDDMTKVMKSYRDKFNEAKICVDKLKEENAKLANDNEVYKSIKKLHEEEIINLKEKLREIEVSHGPDTKLDENVGEINFKVKELQTALAESNIRNKELTDDNDKLKQEVHNMHKMQEEIDKLTEKLVYLPKIEEDLQMKQQELVKLKSENADLQLNLIKVNKEHDKEFLEQMEQLRKENNVLQLNLKSSTKESEKLVQSANYGEQLKVKDSEIMKLKQELESVTFSENTLKEQVKSLKLKLSEMQASFSPHLEEDYNQALSQLSSAQKTITALELEHESKVKEIEDLRKLLQESNAKSDEMFALREQVSLYKNDFEAEKESKVAIKREKDQLAEDLQNLQKRNKQLQNEIETLRARDQPRAEGYTCPKCTFAFSTYQSLENHVHRCLDLDGFP